MSMKQKLINFFFPKYCLNCQKLNSWLCNDCLKKIKLSKTTCFLCGKNNNFGEICSICLYYQGEKGKEWYINNLIWTALYRQKICKSLITSLKYGGVIEIADILAKLLNEKIKDTYNLKDAEIFYIPSSSRQKKLRDFNQAQLIAKKLVKKNSNFNLNNNLILKKFKQKQTSKNIKKRWHNPNQFIYQGKSLQNKNIIIVDDIVTSGATLNQVAKCLKPYTNKKIRGAVIFKS